MPDADDNGWIRATANELNNLLQVIAESSDVLDSLCTETEETEKYFAILRNSIARATKVTRAMVDRGGGSSGEEPAPAADPGQLPDVPPLPPKPTGGPLVPPLTGDVRVHNPSGNRELVMIVDDAGAALAAGCPMIVRPPDETPFSALDRLATLLNRH